MIVLLAAALLAPHASLSDLVGGGWLTQDGTKACWVWRDERSGNIKLRNMVMDGRHQIIYDGVLTGKDGEFQVDVTSGLMGLKRRVVKTLHPKLRFNISVQSGEMTLTPVGSDPYITQAYTLRQNGYPRLRIQDLPGRSWPKAES